MRDEDKELLAQNLWGLLGGRIHVPIYDPVPMTAICEALPVMKSYEAEIDFQTETVRLPITSLHFNDVRRIWETITLYSEVP